MSSTKPKATPGIKTTTAIAVLGIIALGVGTLFVPQLNHTTEQHDIKAAQVYAGQNTTFALTKDGELYSKGLNNLNQLGYVTNQTSNQEWQKVAIEEPIANISTPYTHTAALTTNGKVYTWGDNREAGIGNTKTALVNAPNNITVSWQFDDITAGKDFIVAVKQGSLWVWGKNEQGQLGLGNNKTVTEPTTIPTDTAFISAQAGEDFIIAMDAQNRLWGWGNNDKGQLGLGTTDSHDTPQLISEAAFTTYNANTSSKTVTAIDQAGYLYAWGDNSKGQGGIGEDWRQQQVDENVRVQTQIDEIKAADDARRLSQIRACVLEKEEKFYEEYQKQLEEEAKKKAEEDRKKEEEEKENPTPNPTPPPTNPNGPNLGDDEDEENPPTVEPEAPEEETPPPAVPDYTPECTTTVDETFTFTDTSEIKPRTIKEPALKPGTTTPTMLRSDTLFTSSNTGSENGYAIDTQGKLWAWGSDANGQNANNIDDPKTHTQIPVMVNDTAFFVQLAAGTQWAMVLNDAGTIYTWGKNNNSVLINNADKNLVPTPYGSGYTGIKATAKNGFAFKNQELSAWGEASNGLLGVENPETTGTPTPINVETNRIAVTENSVLALNPSGIPYAWGHNTNNTFGFNQDTKATVITPEQQGIKTFIGMSAGERFTIVLDEYNTLWGWGNNKNNQISADSAPIIGVPQMINIGAKIIDVEATKTGVYALTETNELLYWGNGDATPRTVEKDFVITSFSTGDNYVAILDENNKIYTQTFSIAATDPDSALPRQINIGELDNIESVKASSLFSNIVRTSNGKVYYFGAGNENFPIKNNTESNSKTGDLKELTTESSTAVSVSLSNTHLLIALKNGTIAGLGTEPYGTFNQTANAITMLQSLTNITPTETEEIE